MQVADIRKHPAWFGSVMGTAVLALAILGWRDAWSVQPSSPAGVTMGVLAWGALLAATGLAVVLIPRYATRLTPANRSGLRAELADPAAGALLGTVPGGILVLAVAWPRVGEAALPEAALPGAWILGTVLAGLGATLALVLGIAWALAVADAPEPTLDKVNGGWFIPPVVNVIVALALVPALREVPDSIVTGLWLTGLWFWGAGLLLFLAVLALVVARMAIAPRQPAMMAPSQWIALAPAGIAGVSLVQIMVAGELRGLVGEGAVVAASVVAALLAGLGLWWALMALVSLLRYRREGALPFHPGWWGFTFPLGSMTVSLALQATLWQSNLAAALATVLLGGLLVAWVAAARGSLQATGVRRGS